ncbi:BLUF domain-containing protein [uncultured Ruegeria sp.]|uniref:BLUF domain-containing protein n=1 Tax=uncultured Ruegeria sp. TaxID=259304 RepID=UPI0026167796|nr:BLUF domain-containing protein [uncultured Ruegeria sp.]
MSLTRLIYYSLRNPSVSADVPKLIETSIRNNRAMNVTGILHYNKHAFLQVLEGHRAEVSAIYHRITTDTRHINIILVECVGVNERMFPHWSMALHEGMDDTTRSVFLRYFGSTKVNPETVGPQELLKALQELSADLKHNLPAESD